MVESCIVFVMMHLRRHGGSTGVYGRWSRFMKAASGRRDLERVDRCCQNLVELLREGDATEA